MLDVEEEEDPIRERMGHDPFSLLMLRNGFIAVDLSHFL
jgi:hypothetical protein